MIYENNTLFYRVKMTLLAKHDTKILCHMCALSGSHLKDELSADARDVPPASGGRHIDSRAITEATKGRAKGK